MNAIERWAPVFAKCTLLCRRGILKLLGVDEAFPDLKPSVGQTIYTCLEKRGEQTIQQCVECLRVGWRGWERYRLTEEQLLEFFTGRNKEAEQVAKFLVKFGLATDISSLFTLFAR